MRLKKQLLVLGICLAAASGLATADAGEGFYVGGGVYAVDTDDRISYSDIEDTDTTAAVFVGYRLIEMLGIEAGYYDLGNMGNRTLLGRTEFDGQALTLAGVLTFDIGPIGIYGKAGAAYVDYDASLTLNNGFKISKNDSSVDPFAAVGVSLDIWDTLYVYTEYQRIQTEVDVDMIGVGVRFDF